MLVAVIVLVAFAFTLVLISFFRQDLYILALLFCKGPHGHQSQKHTDHQKKR